MLSYFAEKYSSEFINKVQGRKKEEKYQDKTPNVYEWVVDEIWVAVGKVHVQLLW
jgi:hypothetical protein